MCFEMKCLVSSRSQRISLICLISLIYLTIRGFLVIELASPPPSPEVETTRNLSWLVRPWEDTIVLAPSPGLCDGTSEVRLVIAVFSAPPNLHARSAIRLGDMNTEQSQHKCCDDVETLGARGFNNILE